MIVTGVKHLLPDARLPKAARTMKSWKEEAPSEPWPCLLEAAVIILIDTDMKRAWLNVAAFISTAFQCLPMVSAEARIRASDLAIPGDPRFAGITDDSYIVIENDKSQKEPRIVDVYEVLTMELLSSCKKLSETK